MWSNSHLYFTERFITPELDLVDCTQRLLFHPQGFYELGQKGNQCAEYGRIASTIQNGMATVLDSVKYPIYGLLAWNMIRNLL